uniref:Hsp70-Hsp90 organising protein n=1 Tax=Bicosoecida sp. CB-2014 TaxID=1486930 RepID=A0A7S1G9V5_9STRA
MAEKAAEFKAKGNAFLGEGKFAEAAEAYTEAIALDGSNHVFYSNRSAAYLSMGDAEKALADADKCIEVNPSFAKGYGRKGAALHKLGRPQDSVEAYEAGLKVAPGNAALQEGLKAVQQDAGPFGSSMWARLAMGPPKFREYMGDPSYMAMMQAIQRDQSTLMNFQHDPRLMETVTYLLGMGMPEGAEEGTGGASGGAASEPAASSKEAEPEPEPERVPTPEPATEEEKEERERRRKGDALKDEGNAAYKAKDFDEALRLYDAAIEAYDGDVTYILNKASVRFAQKEYDACIELCREAIDKGRDIMAPFDVIAKAFTRMGNAALKKGDYDAAIEAYESSLTETDSGEVRTKLYKTRQIKKKKETEAYYDDDKAAEAKERGNALFKAGDFRGAIEEYSEAIKRNPKSAVYYNNRATAKTKMMDWVGALADCNKAISIDPAYVKAYSRKGHIETFTKEYHRAMETYKQGLALAPDDPECREGLQRVVMKINASAGEEVDKERASRAMSDPEIQRIMGDPMVQQALRDMQTSPEYATKAMMDPEMGPKIQKLIAAGVLQVK